MSDIDYGLIPDGEEPNPRFNTYAKLEDTNDSNDVDHLRVSVKEDDEGQLECLKLQPFISPTSPHPYLHGPEVESENLDTFLTALEMVRRDYR